MIADHGADTGEFAATRHLKILKVTSAIPARTHETGARQAKGGLRERGPYRGMNHRASRPESSCGRRAAGAESL
ncbi:hypothetical protein HMPREF0185_00164 [Brevundimonas diminuta 470-4]|nr:hypothetical protein HMPREF0185_00164 [Brevundimonas diminuta 470-4]